MDTKVCTRCKKEFVLDAFYKDKSSKTGLTAACKICITKARNYEYNRNYLRSPIYREKRNIKRVEEYHKLSPAQKMFYKAKQRASKKGLEFSITIDDLEVPEICPILNIPFKEGFKNDYEYTHSLDRIDPKKGYSKDNIQVISMKANTMKNNATALELVSFALWVLNNDDIVQTAYGKKDADVEDKEPLR